MTIHSQTHCKGSMVELGHFWRDECLNCVASCYVRENPDFTEEKTQISQEHVRYDMLTKHNHCIGSH